MARPRQTANLPVIPSNSLVASAARLGRSNARIFNPNKGTWQADCYRHYRICGEARYAATFVGNAVSRATLTILNGDGKKVDDGPAVEALNELFNGSAGQSQMLADIGLHLTIAGECFLVGRSAGGVDVWEVVSVLEIKTVGGRWSLTYPSEDIKDTELSDSDVVIRIWNPMPGNRMDADSPFRSLLPILTEIEWLTSHVFSQIRSRLLGAGILFMPQGMTFPPPPPGPDGKEREVANEAEGFMLSLAAGMEKALRRDGNPSEVVPLIVIAPGQEIQYTKLMDFWTNLDAEAKELRTEAIRRFAQGMNLPVEEVLGMSANGGTGGGNSNGVSHWGAWQIEESTIKMHVEPMLDTIVNALTLGYIRPLLEDGATERVGHDTSALKLRPDRSRESIELYNLGLLSPEKVIEENGFDAVADMMTREELIKWLLRKVATGSTTPEQVAAALTALGVDGMEPTQDEQPRQERPDPSLEDHPSKPRTPDESALLMACDALVLRALELAGKRALNGGLRGKNRDKDIEPTEFHLERKFDDCTPLLDGVFSHGPRILSDAWPHMAKHLADYCAALILSQTPHTRENLHNFLSRRNIVAPPVGGQAPIALTVNVNGHEQPVTFQLPDHLVDVTLPEITLDPKITLAPQIKVDSPQVHTPAPIVNVTNDVQTPSVTVTNQVETPSVTVTNEVQTPEVTVAAPNVEVKPEINVAAAPVKVIKGKPRKVKVLRDGDGKIVGAEEQG